MIGIATGDHELDGETVKIEINTNEYDQQKNVSMEFDVVHNLSEKHLTPTTTTVKRGSSMFMSGNFRIIEETYSPQLTYMLLQAFDFFFLNIIFYYLINFLLIFIFKISFNYIKNIVISTIYIF